MADVSLNVLHSGKSFQALTQPNSFKLILGQSHKYISAKHTVEIIYLFMNFYLAQTIFLQ